MTGTFRITNNSIRSAASSNWDGDPGAEGKIQYHANRWYIVADSSSDRIVQFRRNGTDVSYIDNSGTFQGNAATSSSCSGNAATSSSCSGNAATATTASSCSGNAATATSAGSATYATYASHPAFSGDSVDKDDLTTRTESGFYQSSSGTNAEGWPRNDSTWQHMIACTHTNDSNYYSMQLGAGFFSQNLYYRSVNGAGGTGWTSVLIANSGSYSGSLTMSDNITAYSDLKLKQNIFTIDSALEKVKNLRGVYYTRKDDETNKRKVGVIAQEIELVLPEVVMKNVKEETKEETLSVDYGNITALLIEAMKEQQATIESLKDRILVLENIKN
jgi:hypothetical protein